MRTLPWQSAVAICRKTTTGRAASNHVSLSLQPHQMGRARQTAAIRRAPQRQSRRGTMLPSSISSFGLTNNPALAPFANLPCRCKRYFMGGEGAWDHVNSCLRHAPNWTCAHDHVLPALERICNDAGFATTHKRCSRVRATVAPISRSATSAWRSRPI